VKSFVEPSSIAYPTLMGKGLDDDHDDDLKVFLPGVYVAIVLLSFVFLVSCCGLLHIQ